MKNRWLQMVWGLGVLVAAASFAVCRGMGGHEGERVVVIPDASQPAEFTVSDGNWFRPLGHPSGVSVRVVGAITGEAEIQVGEFAPQQLAGPVDWWDYRDDTYEIVPCSYRPWGRVSGRLEVYIRFH